MGILEQVTGLKEKGASEDEIVKTLRGQGVSPKEISEALSQAKIKSAVSSGDQGENSNNQNQEMEPSMMGSGSNSLGDQEGDASLPTENISDEDLEPPKPSKNSPPQTKGFKPMTREVSEQGSSGQEGDYIPQGQNPSSYTGQMQAPYPRDSSYGNQEGYDEYYGQEGDYYSAGDSDTMIEIAEQVFAEKIKDIQKKVGEFNEFKTLSEERIGNISERLKRIESSIDRLQADILEKVGSYGRGLESVKKEMGMMQESFGKVVNTLADKSEGKHHRTKRKTKSKSKKK